MEVQGSAIAPAEAESVPSRRCKAELGISGNPSFISDTPVTRILGTASRNRTSGRCLPTMNHVMSRYKEVEYDDHEQAERALAGPATSLAPPKMHDDG